MFFVEMESGNCISTETLIEKVVLTWFANNNKHVMSIFKHDFLIATFVKR